MERERRGLLKLFWTIHGVLSVGIRRAKSENSSTRQGLRVGTKNEEFHKRFEEGGMGKSDFLHVGGVLETSFGSTMLQEVEILPTLVYSYFCGLIST